MLDHRQGQRMLGSCETCGKGAIGPTNLRKHMHQEVALSSYEGGHWKQLVELSQVQMLVFSQPNKYIRANVMISDLVM